MCDERLLLVLFLFLISRNGSFAISDSARRVGRTFEFVISSQPGTNTSSECPQTINHSKIRTYRGVNPSSPSQILDGIVWRDLIVNQISCLDSPSANAATYFTPQIPSPPSTPPDTANPFFLTATDNSPRQCGPFTPQNPARYFFTDDMPRYKQRFLDQGLLPRGDIIFPPSLDNPVRGDIFMFSQQFTSSDSTVLSSIICTFRAPAPSITPSPSNSPEDSGSVCFPPTAQLTRPDLSQVPIHAVSIGDLVQVSSTLFSPIISFSHREPNRRTQFLHLSFQHPAQLANTSHTIQLTSSHLLRRLDGTLIPAGNLRIGDAVRVIHKSHVAFLISIRRVWRVGVYSPITEHGDLVVDGVIASCYTTSIRALAAHALLVPVRAAFRFGLAVDWCGTVDGLRWAFR